MRFSLRDGLEFFLDEMTRGRRIIPIKEFAVIKLISTGVRQFSLRIIMYTGPYENRRECITFFQYDRRRYSTVYHCNSYWHLAPPIVLAQI